MFRVHFSIFLFFLVYVFSFVFMAFTLTFLWEWFISSVFNVKTIGIFTAMGIILFIKIFNKNTLYSEKITIVEDRNNTSKTGKSNTIVKEMEIMSIYGPLSDIVKTLAFLSIGWLVHQF